MMDSGFEALLAPENIKDVAMAIAGLEKRAAFVSEAKPTGCLRCNRSAQQSLGWGR